MTFGKSEFIFNIFGRLLSVACEHYRVLDTERFKLRDNLFCLRSYCVADIERTDKLTVINYENRIVFICNLLLFVRKNL